MAISIIRPSAIPVSDPLASGPILLPTIDGLHDAATWFASNGKLALSLQSKRMNGRLAPVAGVSGGNLSTMDQYSTAHRVFVPNGYNSFALQVSFRIDAFPTGTTGITARPVLHLEWLKGSKATPIQTYRYDNPAIILAGGQGYALIVYKLPYKALGSPHTMQELWLRTTVDLCDGDRTLDGTAITSPTANSVYRGIDYLQLHLFKNTSVVF